MAEIQVKRAEATGGKKVKKRTLYAQLSFFYPQYTLKDAQELSARDLYLLLKTARQEEAKKMYNMTLIIASPHGKNKNTVKNLLEHFRKLTKD